MEICHNFVKYFQYEKKRPNKNLHNDLNIFQFFRIDVNDQRRRCICDQKFDWIFLFVHIEFAIVFLTKNEKKRLRMNIWCKEWISIENHFRSLLVLFSAHNYMNWNRCFQSDFNWMKMIESEWKGLTKTENFQFQFFSPFGIFVWTILSLSHSISFGH